MTALYVPPTDEADHKKQNQSLQLIGSVVSQHEAAWTAFTPIVTANSGTLTTVNTSGRYHLTGKTVALEIIITLTTNGTGAGFLIATLPVTAQGTGNWLLTGREASSGNMLQGLVAGGSGSVSILTYNNLYPGGSGTTIFLSGIYESA